MGQKDRDYWEEFLSRQSPEADREDLRRLEADPARHISLIGKEGYEDRLAVARTRVGRL